MMKAKISEDKQDLLSGQKKKTYQGPKMLYQILLEEYELLGLLDRSAVRDIWSESKRIANRLGILKFEEAQELGTEGRQEPLELRRERGAQLLELLRKKLHELANPRYAGAGFRKTSHLFVREMSANSNFRSDNH